MILTQCACCAAPLPHLAKQCSRCKTRYCGPACQEQHWKEGGHDKLCKKIKKGGGAEQYHAKYAQAVIVAVEKCAEDTKGQTCYICTEDLHWKTKEGLVRGCSCRGTAGFAHVSCLAEQAKILLAEAKENNLDVNPRRDRWYMCGLCKQDYHGVVKCALGWASWKTYLGRPETDQIRSMAMMALGSGLTAANHFADASSVQEAELSTMRRIGGSEPSFSHNLLIIQGNLANTYQRIGRHEEGLRLWRDVYSETLKLNVEENVSTFRAASNYASTLKEMNRFEEAKSLLRKTIPVAQRVLGENDELMLIMTGNYAAALVSGDSATLADLREAIHTYEETEKAARRVLGGAHPTVVTIETSLRHSRELLYAREMQLYINHHTILSPPRPPSAPGPRRRPPAPRSPAEFPTRPP